MNNVGYFALVAGIVLSLYTAYSFYAGSKTKIGEKFEKAGNNGIIWQFATITFASMILLIAFINNDFSFGYVADHSTIKMSVFYKIAAFWAGHEGSLLMWLWMITGFTAVIAFRNRNSDKLTNGALYISNYVQLFFMLTLLLASNPFRAALPGMTMPTGAGLNPLLMHWAMVLHPPTLFLGYAGLTIPFAFGIAALIDRNSSSDWVKRSHFWTLFAWFFLTLGIFLGALWAYVVLGWGGYWAWDPVENASILPWFAGTALLHSFTMYRRRGGMKIWAVSLATLAFVMCILATFITRSGLIESVHAFPDLRWDLTFLFGGLMLVSGGLTAYLIQTRREEFETQEFFSDFLSKHFTYYLNNVSLVGFTLIIAGGTVIPPFFGQSLGPEFYNRLAQPLGILYLLLISICPFLGWTKTNGGSFLKQMAVPFGAATVAGVAFFLGWGGEQWISRPMGFATMVVAVFAATAVLELFYLGARTKSKNLGIGFASALFSVFRFNRSQTGGYVSHLGMAIMIFGVAGSMLYVHDIPATLGSTPGEKIRAGSYELKLKEFRQTTRLGQQVTNVIFEMRNLDKGANAPVSEIAPKMVFHELQQQQALEAAIHYEVFRDVFVVFNGVDDKGQIALNIKINPLISFVWIGSVVLGLGTMVAMWPKSTRPRATTRRREDEEVLDEALASTE
ncbi:MAG: cytochrome c biogenesis protein CcsA [Candidatus Aquicultor sp.]|nr:cytochrome c biogenesis protein CcsA [Candidatus Aquicultor sp.]